jgi:hypothetical protein
VAVEALALAVVELALAVASLAEAFDCSSEVGWTIRAAGHLWRIRPAVSVEDLLPDVGDEHPLLGEVIVYLEVFLETAFAVEVVVEPNHI